MLSQATDDTRANVDSRHIDVVGFPCRTNVNYLIACARETTKLSYTNSIVMDYYFATFSRETLAAG
jgi:hypothetical protein